MSLKVLFSPGKIGTLELKNRIILPAMGTAYPDSEGFVTEQLIDYHVARVKGGCALNTVENAAVLENSKAPNTLGIYDDKFLPGFKKLTDRIRREGGKSCIQIWHAGRQTKSSLTGQQIVAPSPIPCPLNKEMPRELTQAEIEEIVEAFGKAALRAKEAGFDSVEVHGAHGYLVSQFMSASSNKRSDHYGGSLENRTRFAREVIQGIRSEVGEDFPLILRISGEEHVEHGLAINDSMKIAQMAEKAGVDAIHVSAGVYASMQYVIPPMDLPIGFNIKNAAVIKKVVNIPVIGVGRINDPVIAADVLASENADFISIGRGQLADPDFCNKSKSGVLDEIVKCIGCNQGCVDRRLFLGEPVSCLRNPACGREKEYQLIKAVNPRKILVAGGGPGGMEAALTLKRRGHDVVLCEKSNRLGGTFSLAGVAPRKGEIAQAALGMGKAATREGVNIMLQTDVTPQVIKKINPDVVIVATGSRPIIPDIPGINLKHVDTADNVLSGSKAVGDNVAVIGGGLVGVEVAEFLAEKGKTVTIIEILKRLAGDLGMMRRRIALRHIDDRGIKVLTMTTCSKITENSIFIEKEGEVSELKGIDSVVIAVGNVPENPLNDFLKTSDLEYYVIGDAMKPRKALDAIWEAAEIGRKI
jgi:2,4-dienoyl-CoA reductase-like NADH-dependent reductase (Old Yellow Enzyme family)/thioredoxin reductase